MDSDDVLLNEVKLLLSEVVLKIADESSRRPSSSARDEDRITFYNVQYLGSTTVPADGTKSRSSVKFGSILTMLNSAAGTDYYPNEDKFAVSLCISKSLDGDLKLFDGVSTDAIISFPLMAIERCIRGAGKEGNCIIIAVSKEDVSFDLTTYGFRFNNADTAAQVLRTFHELFRVPEGKKENCHHHKLRLYVDIKEPDKKSGAFVSVSRDRDIFRLRMNCIKQVVISIEKRSSYFLRIERCFGILMAQGTDAPNLKMKLLDMEESEFVISKDICEFRAIWPADLFDFNWLSELNKELDFVFVTFAIDLVFAEMVEPTRFKFECKVRMIDRNRFSAVPPKLDLTAWYNSRKQLHEDFVIVTERIEDDNSERRLRIVRAYPCPDSKYNVRSIKFIRIENIENNRVNTDYADLVLSGMGDVKKECSEVILLRWKEAIEEVRNSCNWRDIKQIIKLVDEVGIPDQLRGEAWLRLAKLNPESDQEIYEAYRKLSLTESPSDSMISKDLARTFPAHEYFQKTGGLGQESLFRICRAYSLYDRTVSYCQGISFISAALLTHMPEEQAFLLLVKIMYDYDVRGLFLSNFSQLYCCLHQLVGLMKEYLPDLHRHFKENCLEPHMYALQWFLTLFTAKFQLPFVFRVLDLFLAHGFSMVFSVSLGILKYCSDQLMMLDFEGALHYFRVVLPRLFKSDEDIERIIRIILSAQISERHLKKYEKEYLEGRLSNDDPLCRERLLEMNHDLQCDVIRLQTENDSMLSSFMLIQSKLESEIEQRNQEIARLNRLVESTNEVVKRERSINSNLNQKINGLERQHDLLLNFNENARELWQLYKELYFTLKRETNTDPSLNILSEMEAKNLEATLYSVNIHQNDDRINDSNKSSGWLKAIKKTLSLTNSAGSFNKS